jgi:hypothetical protein
MRLELLEEVRAIGNNPAVITDDFLAREARFTDRKGLPTISAAVFWIAVLVD